MRALAVILLVITAGAASADPASAWIEATRSSARTDRLAAAASIVAAIEGHDADTTVADASALAMRAVITDDDDVRAMLIGALVATGHLEQAAVRNLPSRKQVEHALRDLTSPHSSRWWRMPVELPGVDTCGITVADERGFTVACHHSSCRAMCRHLTTDVRFRFDRKAKLLDQHDNDDDDGVCGCCMRVMAHELEHGLRD